MFYLDKVFGNLPAILQHSDWRDDPVPLHPDHSLALILPREKDIFFFVMWFRSDPHLKETRAALNSQRKSQEWT